MFLSFLLTQHKWRMFKKSKGKHDSFNTFLMNTFCYFVFILFTNSEQVEDVEVFVETFCFYIFIILF